MLTGSILLTGGTGSLGRALLRRAAAERWDARFTVLSRSEALQALVRAEHPNVRFVLGDVRDTETVMHIVPGHDTVIHAAAMKRIPECEAQPWECIQTNVIGSRNVLRAAQLGGVKLCVGISTDKAVEPITTYGASKRLMEQMWCSVDDDESSLRTVCCRYGNVVSSRGSVIPIWRAQAKMGRPVTVTLKHMTRFWLGVEDAVDVLLQTIIETPHRAIYVPKCKRASIADVASWIVPNVELKEIGLRSIERQHERLAHGEERVVDYCTHMIVRPQPPNVSFSGDYNSLSAERLTESVFLRYLAQAEAYDD